MFVGRDLSEGERATRTAEFIVKLRSPGVYEVGGLGACTLLSREAMQKGFRFAPIPNLSFWGEDRHACVRAAALGLQLFIDTHYPAYHIYRDSDLTGVEAFVNQGAEKKTRVTLSMIVRNEADRYLEKVLTATKGSITDAVIIDDGSDDRTLQVCCELLQGIPFKIVHNDKSKFHNEIDLRKQQWEETVGTNPDWILTLDADEVFETDLNSLDLNNPAIDAYYFRLFDMWNDHHYRYDQYWQAHLNYRPFLIRYKPELEYKWKETPQHCGRLPTTVSSFSYKCSDIRLKHYGWAKEEDRKMKYERYRRLDPDSKFGWHEQYVSILNQTPNLVKF